MVKKALLPIIFLMLMLPGCTGTGTLESVTESAKSIPITGPNANPAECANSAEFVSDVTVPDGTTFSAGETIAKIWRVKNTGTCPWAEMYTLVFVRGEQMGAPDSIPLRVTQPGETLDIAIDMIAPEIEGEHRADFELRDPAGNAIPVDNGTVLWVIITVGTGTTDAGE